MSVDQFQKTGRNALEQVDGILRNGWTDSPEYADASIYSFCSVKI